MFLVITAIMAGAEDWQDIEMYGQVKSEWLKQYREFQHGITVIKANGKGISVFDKTGINESPISGWVWRFPPNTQPPIGLKLGQDNPHHFCIAPTQNMPIGN